MHIEMTETQKYHLLFKESNSNGSIGTSHNVELLYNGQISDIELAFEKLIESQPMLRAKISDKKYFKIEKFLKYKIPVTFKKNSNSSLLKQKRITLSQKKYDLNDYPLFTIEAIEEREGFRIFLNLDSIIIDNLGLSQIIEQLNIFLFNKNSTSVDLSNELCVIVDNYFESKESKVYKEAKDHFMKNMREYSPEPQINYRNDSAIESIISHKVYNIDKVSYELLKKKAANLSTSTTNILLVIYSMILSKWSKNGEFSINLHSSNSTLKEKYPDVINNNMTSFLLQINFDFNKSFIENIRKIDLSMEESLELKYFETTEVIRKINENSHFSVCFESELNKEGNNYSSTLLKEDYRTLAEPYTNLKLHVKSTVDGLIVSWSYRNSKFEEVVINTMMSEYCSAVFGFLNSTEDIVNKYKEVKKDELLLKYAAYNSQSRSINFNSNSMKYHLEKVVERYPNKLFAVINNKEYTFSEIFELAVKKADEICKIKKINNKEKTRIAFNGKKNLNSLICILASILTNDSFCVINEDFGNEKSEETLKSLQNYIYIENGTLIKASNESLHIDEDESYVIHTSGTTGKPKGISISETAVLNTVYDILDKFDITEKDTLLNISNLYFDLSIFDIFGSVISGMTIIFMDVYDNKWVFDNNYHKTISIWNSTPSLAKEFLLKHNFEKLESVLVSGDFVPKTTVEKLFDKYNDIQLYALGGATEASIWSNYYDCSLYKEVSTIPYGKPLANQQLYIVTPKGELCDFNVLGEICIAGKGLAKGYLNKMQTNSAFIWNKEIKDVVYRTGDLGYLSTNNFIYIVGRVESEIKHNGYRIDLREIEKYVNKQDSILDSFAFIKKTEKGNTRLVCAVVCKKNLAEKSKIRLELSKDLPLYMIPNHIIITSKIPLTRNGKVDIKSLCNMIQN